jgi:hypothetical protein
VQDDFIMWKGGWNLAILSLAVALFAAAVTVNTSQAHLPFIEGNWKTAQAWWDHIVGTQLRGYKAQDNVTQPNVTGVVEHVHDETCKCQVLVVVNNETQMPTCPMRAYHRTIAPHTPVLETVCW